MSKLVNPHGQTSLKPLLLKNEERDEEIKKAEKLKKIPMSSRELSDLLMMGMGAYTPLNGFMCEEDWRSCCLDLKTTEGFTKLSPTIFCVSSIVVCLFCLSKAMTIIPVGFTYATYGALTITAVTLFGILKYNQSPNIYGTLGLILIVSGVILLNLFGKLK